MKNVARAEMLAKAKSGAKTSKGYMRVTSFLDSGSFCELDALAASGGGYAEAVAGYGTADGCPVCVFAQSSDIAGGAMSKAQASKLQKLYRLAVKKGIPVVGFFDSEGARVNESSDILKAYGDILLDANRLSGVVPQIAVILGPCTGTAAMIAAGADIVIMSAKGELTVSTGGESGKPEEAAKCGIAHITVETEEQAMDSARRLISVLPSNNLEPAPDTEPAEPELSHENMPDASDARQVIGSVCDTGSFIELGKGFSSGSITGIGQINGLTSGIISLTGIIDADSCSKAARFLRFCDSFSIPAVTFVNAEKFATLKEASKLSSAYSEATTAKVTVVTGRACGAVYIAVAGRGANSDYTVSWPDAVISPLAPETAAIFLWNDKLKGSADPVNDRKKLIETYKTTEASPIKAAADGLVENVITPDETRCALTSALNMLSGKRVSTLPKKHSNIQL